MKRIFITFLALGIACNLTLSLPFSAQCREISKSGQVFQEVKDGVVTVFSSWSHGSGFLVDENGLIVTNSHVVNEVGDNLRIRFGPGQIIEGCLMENDREHDIAVIRVNLANIKNYKVLPLFKPSQSEPLVVIGEQVIAVGSPIAWEILERTMTQGVVGKFEGDVIRHDAAINGGNSGGPLFNYDGEVVGLNTFGSAERGQAIAGAVPITFAIPVIAAAKAKMIANTPPSPELLPDVSTIAYPLHKILKEHPQSFKAHKSREYIFGSGYFQVGVLTPPRNWNILEKIQNEQLAARKKRAQKKGFEISEDELDDRNLIKYYNYEKPVVILEVVPKPKMTTGSKVTTGLWLLASSAAAAVSFGGAAPLYAASPLFIKKEIKKDFLRLSLQSADGSYKCSPLSSGRMPIKPNETRVTGYVYEHILDKSYKGVYEFDPKCFQVEKPLFVTLKTEGDDKDKTIAFPEIVKKRILADYKPYWDFIASLEAEKKEKATQQAETKAK